MAAIALISAALALVAWGVRLALKVAKRATHFMDDFFGEAARPGVPAKPGLVERLTLLESQSQEILHEVTLNSGQSIKDVVNRTESAVSDLAYQMRRLPGGNP